MIDLTPLEVRKKKGDFRKQMRGYDPELVDDFLDLVADRLEQLVRENMTISERASIMETQVADYRDRERALTEALVTAQEMREEVKKQLAKETELSRREAEAAAESIRSAAAQSREKEEDAIRRLRARQTQLLSTYRSFLERELAELAVMTETLEVHRSRPVFPDVPDDEEPVAAAPAAAAPAEAPTTRKNGQSGVAAPKPEPLLAELEDDMRPTPQMNLADEIDDEGEEESGWVSTLLERKT